MVVSADNSKLTKLRGTFPREVGSPLAYGRLKAQPLKPHKLLQGVREVLGLSCLGAACDPGVEASLHP
jgi:hypothetical protein